MGGWWFVDVRDISAIYSNILEENKIEQPYTGIKRKLFWGIYQIVGTSLYQ